MKRIHSNRFWIALLAVLFIICAAAALLLSRHDGRTIARITLDGEVLREIDLSAVTLESQFTLETPYGINVIAVRPGGICILNADCPDQVCVHQGWLTGGRVPIVCLPHRLVISLEAGGSAEAFDVITG